MRNCLSSGEDLSFPLGGGGGVEKGFCQALEVKEFLEEVLVLPFLGEISYPSPSAGTDPTGSGGRGVC